MLSETTDWLVLSVQSAVDITAFPVQVSFSRDPENLTKQRWDAEHVVGGFVRVLIGPESEVGRLAAGVWWAFVHPSGLNPRVPVVPAWAFVIEGGPTPAEVESGATIALDSDGVPYFAPVFGSTGPLALDSDGVPYFIPEEV